VFHRYKLIIIIIIQALLQILRTREPRPPSHSNFKTFSSAKLLRRLARVPSEKSRRTPCARRSTHKTGLHPDRL